MLSYPPTTLPGYFNRYYCKLPLEYIKMSDYSSEYSISHGIHMQPPMISGCIVGSGQTRGLLSSPSSNVTPGYFTRDEAAISAPHKKRLPKRNPICCQAGWPNYPSVSSMGAAIGSKAPTSQGMYHVISVFIAECYPSPLPAIIPLNERHTYCPRSGLRCCSSISKRVNN